MKMKRHNWAAIILVATILASGIIASSRTQGAEQHSAAPAAPSGGSSSSMVPFYAGRGPNIGTFSGKLVCLRCDLQPGPGAMSQCAKEGHRHALSMDSDKMIHPLLAGTEEVLAQINSGELHGKNVAVHGKYYASTGAILVDRIEETK